MWVSVPVVVAIRALNQDRCRKLSKNSLRLFVALSSQTNFSRAKIVGIASYPKRRAGG